MKRLLALLMAAVLLVTFAACSDDDDNDEEEEETTQEESSAPETEAPVEDEEEDEDEAEDGEEEEEASASDIVTIEHDYGVTEVAVNPEKLVVFDLGIMDIMDNVGIPVGGFPATANLPAYLEHMLDDLECDAGGMKEVDLEAVYEYDPDLIIISGRIAGSGYYDECAEIAPTLYLATPGTEYFETMAENIEILAQIFPDKADEILATNEQILAESAELQAAAQESGLNALIIMANDGNLSFFGTDSRYGVIHQEFGFEEAATHTIEESTHGEEGSFEYIAEVDPDVIFVIDRSAAIGQEGDSGAATLLDNDLVNGTAAAQNDRIIYLSSDVWYLASGGLTGTLQMIQEVWAALD